MATGNSTYTIANYAATSIQDSFKKTYKALWSTAFPIVEMIINKGRWNKGGRIARGKQPKFILPIGFAGPATAVAGEARSASLTPLTPAANSGLSQVEYSVSRYRTAFWLDPFELQFMIGGERGNYLEGLKNQVQDDFRRQLSADLYTSALDSDANVIGFPYVLSTSNSPGGVTQGGANTYWNAKVNTSGGAFTTSPVDDDYDAILDEGRSTPDILMLSRNSTVNLFGRLRDTVANQQRIVQQGGRPKSNFTSFIYLDMDCFADGRLGDYLSTTGGYMMLSSDSWYWKSDANELQMEKPERIQGTQVYEYYFANFVALGTNDCAVNAYRTNFT